MRYFIVFYVAINKNKREVTGRVNFTCEVFPSLREMEEKISASYGGYSVITNIIELNKADYESAIL